MRKIFLLPAICAMALFVSCGGGNIATEENTDSVVTDSIIVDELFTLPDTAFASVEKVKYIVDVMSDKDSTITSLEDLYANHVGSYTFRGGLKRDANFGGTVKGNPDTIIVDWEFHTDVDNTPTKVGTWGGGSGWTGQPVYVEWDENCVKTIKKNDSTVALDFSAHEIIVGSLSSNVYFINYEKGTKNREAIYVTNPIKGSVSLDPLMNGKLYVGHGVPAREPFGAITIDVFKHNVEKTYGRDGKAWRGWGAYDSSAIRIGQFVFRPGENGTIYKFYVKDGVEELHSTLRYRVNGAAPGIESSMAVYMNYGYVGDNHGNILCVNLNTMRPVWYFNNHDDTDATPVVAVEEGRAYVYVGCEVDRQGDGIAHLSKLDALNGSLIWEFTQSSSRFNTSDKHFDGGFYSTLLLGQGNCKDLLFVNCVVNSEGQQGYFYAIDRKSGKDVYKKKLRYYSWFSPVGFLNEKGEFYVVNGDTAGNVYLFNGKSGDLLCVRHIGHNFESSPVVVGNTFVVGSRGNTIYRMSVQ